MNFVDQLRTELQRRKERNSLYSLRAFARDLEVSDSMLSKILKGKKTLSLNLLTRFLTRLNLEEDKKRSFLGAHSEYYERINIKETSGKALLVQDVLMELLTHHKVLELDQFLELTPFKEEEILKELSLLESHKLIQKVGEKEYQCVFNNTDCVSLEFSSQELRDYQKTLQEISINSIEKIKFNERLHSSMMMNISESKLDELKKEILKFQKKVNEIAQEDVSKDKKVYTFQCSLFPIVESIQKAKR